ncbi:cobaltochelatase subunit CobN [Chitinophaga sp. MD30]|uniref:cobaltochelatase subunit CobN n=2 Tax=Chitinophaga TaxID=79328 RepID=UPI0018DF83F0|nr:cobaltochelatase subunit CobN [Chitinophaga sp. MD30]
MSPHLQHDPYAFKAAAAHFKDKLQIDLYGVDGGELPPYSLDELAQHDLVIFESMGARLSLMLPQVDSLKAKTKVLFLETPLAKGNISVADHPDIPLYWSNGNEENYSGLLSYIGARIFGLKIKITPPRIYPAAGFYYPGRDSLFTSAGAYLQWYDNEVVPGVADPVTVGLAFYQSNYVKQDMRHIDALINSIKAHGARPITLVAKGPFRIDSLFTIAGKPIVDVMLYGGMFLDFNKPEAGRLSAQRLDVPLLGAVTHYYKSRAEWISDPGGFAPDMSDRFFFTERDGVFEPINIGAEEVEQGRRYTMPIQDQVDWRVERALAWAKLRRTPNAQKKIVVTYYSEGSGKATVGADIDAYLDVPGSLEKLLKRWQQEGYNVGTQPLPGATELARDMSLHASNVGTWAPGELQKRTQNGPVIRIPEAEYLSWFHSYPKEQQEEVIRKWGPPPGKLMTTTNAAGQKEFLIPVLQYGNIILAPHPNWGLQDNPSLIYGKEAIPPNHAYIAFYEWMKRSCQPHAFISLFTQLSLMPGKQEGPARNDWVGTLIGNLPHISVVPLIAGSGPGNKRRANALTIGYITTTTTAGLDDSLQLLYDKIGDWQDAANAVLKERLEKNILAKIKAQGLDKDIGKDTLAQQAPATLIQEVRRYLLNMSKERMPAGGHILGNAPQGELLVDMVAGMLGKELEQLAPGKNKREVVKTWLRQILLQGQPIDLVTRQSHTGKDTLLQLQLKQALEYQTLLQQTDNEVTQIIRALNGRYISTGPSDDPVRNPLSLPSGRNPYPVNVKAVPSKEAWELGQRMADQLLLQYEEKHGKGAYPKKIAFVLWSSEITHTQGVTEAEILYLMGVEPVWNSKGQVMDVRLIPSANWKRPRIDVLITTSGTYRDHFGDKIKLLDKAVKLAAAVKENENWVWKNTEKYRQQLKPQNQSATARIFSGNTGAYSTNLEFATEQGESWKSDTTLSKLYLDRMAYAYGEEAFADYQRSLFELNVKDVDAAAFSRSSNAYGILDHPMVAAYFGAYNLAVKNTTGRQPDMFINDMQHPEDATSTPLHLFFHKELRSRYLNPKWMKAMMEHGYDGARYMEAFTENMMLWDVTTPDMVKDEDWNEVYDVYVKDREQLGLDKYFEKHNPFAQQALLATMLEATEKGYWQASEEQLRTMATTLTNTVNAKGPACNSAVCNAPGLTRYIKGILQRVPGGAALAGKYQAQLDMMKTNAGATAAGKTVSGKQLVEQKRWELNEHTAGNRRDWWLIGGLLLGLALIFLLGWWRQTPPGPDFSSVIAIMMLHLIDIITYFKDLEMKKYIVLSVTLFFMAIGTQAQEHHTTKVLRHMVLLKFKEEKGKEEVQKVIDAFKALSTKIKEVKALESGINNSPEHLNDGFTHCFFLSFATEADRDSYLVAPDHVAFVKILKPVLDKVLAFDYWQE